MPRVGADDDKRKDADDASAVEEAPDPQPERHEPKLPEPGARDLSKRDYVAIVKRSFKEAKDDQITDLAAALAYYSFLAIPSTLLVAVGAFSLAAGPEAITTLIDKLRGVVPAQAADLLGESLARASRNQGSSLVMTIVGFLLALWATTGAMTAFMRALNRAYDRDETRGFVKLRLTALLMVVVMGFAFLLVFVLLILGPHVSDWVGETLGIGGVIDWVWWTLQWPILVIGLLAAFATLLYLGPNVDHPRWTFLTAGTLLAVVLWLVASGAFALYTSAFGSYNKTWGSLAAVVIMLTWLWLTGLALLLGAEVNAEAERSRELRRGEPAEVELQAPARA